MVINNEEIENSENFQNLALEGKASEIKKQAKQILDKFADALKSVDKIDIDSYVDRDEFERVESISSSKADESSKNTDKSVKSFKQKILENAPKHDDDFILVEKGSWK